LPLPKLNPDYDPWTYGFTGIDSFGVGVKYDAS